MYDGMSGNPNFIIIMEILRYKGIDHREDIVKKIMLYTLMATVERHKPREERIIKKSTKASKR